MLATATHTDASSNNDEGVGVTGSTALSSSNWTPRVAMIVQHNQSSRSPFENGSMTQPLMMCLAFEKAGIEFDLFASEECAYFNYRVRSISTLLEATKAVKYAAVLMVAHLTTFEDSPAVAEIAQNARLVHVLCGHHALFSLEDIVFKKNRCTDMLVNKYASSTWIFDMHAEFSSVYNHWLKTPVHTYPYVWSSVVVDAHVREHATTVVAVAATPELPLTIVIAEPSINVTKSCFFPLVAANAYARAHPERVRRVILLCKPSGPGFEAFARYMDAIGSKLEMHDRLAWPGVACQLMVRRDTVPILFSHHMFNAMNFLSLETMYLGMPIVHNADALRPAGFFYEGWDVAASHAQLDRVWAGERNAEVSRSILHRYDPSNAEVSARFAKLLGAPN